jgi:hypothetical protein
LVKFRQCRGRVSRPVGNINIRPVGNINIRPVGNINIRPMLFSMFIPKVM